MKKVNILFATILLCWANTLFSQATVGSSSSSFTPPQKQSPPVPTAAAFEKYGNIPVGGASGIPEINVPITVLKVKGFEWPISMSYHAGGIKPSEIASSVGLGWVGL